MLRCGQCSQGVGHLPWGQSASSGSAVLAELSGAAAVVHAPSVVHGLSGRKQPLRTVHAVSVVPVSGRYEADDRLLVLSEETAASGWPRLMGRQGPVQLEVLRWRDKPVSGGEALDVSCE